MRRIFLLFILYLSLIGNSLSQSRNILTSAEGQIKEQQRLSTSIVKTLIMTAGDSLTNDSLKVDIIYFLANLSCDTCLVYLIDHINDKFNYGDGISDLDQSNYTACFSALARISKNSDKRWNLLPPIFKILRSKERDENFMEYLYGILGLISKNTTKAILIEELGTARTRKSDSIYEKNLMLLLHQFE